MNERIAASSRYLAPRVLAGLVALPVTAFAIMTIATTFRGRFDSMGAAFGAFASVIAILAWWFALRGHIPESRARIRTAVLGGFVLGAVGFAGGFFGPIVLRPEANQGPLLGIFFTGPLGFALGVLIGWLYSLFRRKGVPCSS